ncbi:MAG: alpha/beta hydrolase [Pseudomonadales bacterium]|nr:alpha/beta hydrolase [Pseudomonadales bacterium]
MEKLTITVNELPLSFVDTGGTGTPILFVHGNSGSSHDFHRQLGSDLARDYRLIAMDLPGHGDSGWAKLSQYGIPFYAETMVTLARSLDAEAGVFVGWSLGGHAVLEAVPELPAAKGFVIFGTPPLRCPPNIEEAFLPNPDFGAGMQAELDEGQASNYAASFLGLDYDRSLAESFARQILRTDPAARAGLASSAARPFVDEVLLLSSMTQPLAIFHGEQEKLVDIAYLRSLKAPTLWRNAVQVIEDAGHAIQVEQPARFNDLLRAFLADIGA